MRVLKDHFNSKSINLGNRINRETAARNDAYKADGFAQRRVRDEITDCGKELSLECRSILTRIMRREQEERTHEVLLSKCHKAKFRKNRLWNKKEKNGKVICIKPENYQKNG